jgi:hypothetical protein
MRGRGRFRVAGYWLDFRNEIVPNGRIGPTGVPSPEMPRAPRTQA